MLYQLATYITQQAGGPLGDIGKSNQGYQDSSGNQKNIIQGQRPDTENRQTQQRT